MSLLTESGWIVLYLGLGVICLVAAGIEIRNLIKEHSLMPAETITLQDQIKCCLRELAMRKNVYRKRVTEGRMTSTEANREIAVMAEVVRTLQSMESPDLIP